MKMRKSMTGLVTLTSVFASSASLAHSGEHSVTSIMAALAHMLTEPFHLGMMAAAVIAAIGAFRLWKKSQQQ
jgi:hypothetical protein